jgi:hypothetical protein
MRPEVEAAVEFIRGRWGKTPESRAEFLSEPGGWLAYVDAPMSDEAAADAITVVEAEWGGYRRRRVSLLVLTEGRELWSLDIPDGTLEEAEEWLAGQGDPVEYVVATGEDPE